MSDSPFRDLLSAGAERARLRLDPVQTDLLELYFDLLQRWNRTINLTALPLEPATADTIDRLFIEPLVAAQFLATSSPVWFDLGSGNGSPAIPMKTALPGVDLTMVESRSRRAAFLSEVVRALQLDHSRVENLRFEELPSNEGSIDLITVRAVRLGSALETAARRRNFNSFYFADYFFGASCVRPFQSPPPQDPRVGTAAWPGYRAPAAACAR